MVLCTICSTPWKGTKGEISFVCKLCRCTDCQMVFNFPCDCGTKHAIPSRQDPRVCKECMGIRERVAHLDADLLELRRAEFAVEDKLYE